MSPAVLAAVERLHTMLRTWPVNGTIGIGKARADLALIIQALADARRQVVEEAIAIIETVPTEGLRRQNLAAKLRALLPAPAQESQR